MHQTHKMVRLWFIIIATLLCCFSFLGATAGAVSEAGNVSVTAVVPGDPPTSTAVILSPQSGTTVTITPLVVKGTCQQGLHVAVLNLGALAGNGDCDGDGSFTINIGLLPGKNRLTTKVFDDFDRFGPLGDEVIIFVEISPEPSTTEETEPISQTPPTAGTTSDNKPGGSVEAFVTNNIVTPILQMLHVSSDGPVPMNAQLFYAGVFAASIAVAVDVVMFNALFMKSGVQKVQLAGRHIGRIAKRSSK